jgi:hypothetical protein
MALAVMAGSQSEVSGRKLAKTRLSPFSHPASEAEGVEAAGRPDKPEQGRLDEIACLELLCIIA